MITLENNVMIQFALSAYILGELPQSKITFYTAFKNLPICNFNLHHSFNISTTYLTHDMVDQRISTNNIYSNDRINSTGIYITDMEYTNSYIKIRTDFSSSRFNGHEDGHYITWLAIGYK